MKQHLSMFMAAAAMAATFAVQAKDPITAEFEKFRAVLEEGNPAELFEAQGEDIWKNKKGPDGASMAQCDLGLGAGIVKGAHVQMPRYFADVDRVMDAERRIVHCMVKYLGYKEADIHKKPFSTPEKTPDHILVSTYVGAQSRGMKLAAPQSHPKERLAFATGREIFNYRAGPYDFSCATCHNSDNLRIRTQDLPNLTKPDGAMKASQGHPTYRLTGGFMFTQNMRLNDCYRQQRFPEPGYLSDSLIALLTYMTATANGQVYNGPGIKR